MINISIPKRRLLLLAPLFMMVLAESQFKVDVHTHPIPAFFKDALVDAGYPTQGSEIVVDGFRTPKFTIEEYIKERVEHGYNFSIQSVTAPGVSFLKGNKKARELARRLNNEMSSYIKAYPNQLGAFACLPLPDIVGAIEEIKYCLDELGFQGVGLYTNYDGVYLGDEELDPIFNELQRRDVPVFVHPTNPPVSPKLDNMSLPVIEYTFDTTRAIGNMLFKQYRKKFPTVKIIWSHGGGSIPFLGPRLAVQASLPIAGSQDPDESLQVLKSFYYDTAVVFDNSQFAGLKTFAKTDNILTGSDYPYLPYGLVPMVQDGFNNFDNFTEEEREMIAWRNAFKLFPSLQQIFPDLT